jgi:hypothetical protein
LYSDLHIFRYLFLDFSTLVENRNNFQFSQTVFAKSSGKLILFKTAGNIIPAYSPLKISCRDVIHVISSFLWDKDNHTISLLFFFAKLLGGWTLLNLLLTKLTLKG